MKKILQALCATLCVVLAGCSKEIKVDYNIPGKEKYGQVYMPQAEKFPQEKNVTITNEIQPFVYNAYLGGVEKATSPINVNFKVDEAKVDSFNIRSGTNYTLLPAAAYTLEGTTSVIQPGSQSTPQLHINLKTEGNIQAFKPYVLPVTLYGDGVNFNKALTTTYYVFTASYAPGEVPRQKVLSLGANAGTTIFDFRGNLIRKANDGKLFLYPLNTDGTFGAPKQIGSGWDKFDVLFYFGGNRLVGRRPTESWYNGGIFQHPIDANGNVDINNEKLIGSGWNPFNRILPYKNLVLATGPNGWMNMYPLREDSFNDPAVRIDIKFGWNDFTQITAYQDGLLAVADNGDLYQFPLATDGTFGTERRVGSGWNMYTWLIPSGTDLLGLDSNGDVWRYSFNPVGFWPLKK